MNNDNYTNVRLSKDETTVIVSIGNRTALFSANLFKHLLEVPYTKKDGSQVSVEEIKHLKEKSKNAYANAVRQNQNKSQVGA